MPVSVRDFKARLSHYLAEVRAGKTLEITSHRKVIARVTGVQEPAEEGIDRLVASGVAQWDGGKPRGARIELSPGGTPVSEVVLDQRE